MECNKICNFSTEEGKTMKCGVSTGTWTWICEDCSKKGESNE